MENVLPVVFEPHCCAPKKDPRRHDRKPVSLHITVADTSGMAEGQILNLSIGGCGLRLRKRLLQGQYLWLKVYPEYGNTTPVWDLVRVKWVEDDRVGVEFLCIALESLQRLHELFGDQIALVLEG